MAKKKQVPDITLHQLQDEQKELEAQLTHAVKDFEEATGCIVTALDVHSVGIAVHISLLP